MSIPAQTLEQQVRGAIPLSLGGKRFESKAQGIRFIREILNTSPLACPLEGEAFNIVRELLNSHPEAEQKIGCGIERIEIRINPAYGGKSRSFWLFRVDGTDTDFSYKSCLDGDKAYRSLFLRCCRFAVQEHIDEFRKRFFDLATNPTCPLTGVPLTDFNSHVDHAPPYTMQRIIEAFCTLENVDPKDSSLCDTGQDGKILPTFSSLAFRDRFVAFHNNVVQLRVISAKANVSLVPRSEDA